MAESILDYITSPQDLKKLNIPQMEKLAGEIRECLIKTISQNGGHLASNLGTVELTLAIHYVFNCPEDQIIWDVGHQSYTHKLLTGRQTRFSSIRQPGGISGYPKHQESIYDAFIAGHSSTSISAAEGIARARSLKGESGWSIAVVGDGAFTGGMIYEALNNVRSGDRLLIILNDNGMSISRNVGSLAEYIAKIRTKPAYFKAKDQVVSLLEHIPLVGTFMKEQMLLIKKALRLYLYHSNLFESFGLSYLGPVDGHNLRQLTDVLSRAKDSVGPVFVHVRTLKGKGYPYAEQSPQAFHGVSGFDITTGDPEIAQYDSFSTVFGKELTRLAREDSSICAITAAMETGTGLQYFSREFNDKGRFFDVGIAESHAVTFAAGLAAAGMRPVFAVYSTFLQRAIDQIIHDCAIERQHVIFAVDRAGVVGDDGETHQGVFDVSLLTSVPGITIYSPADFEELRFCLQEALYHTEGPCAVRYPRGSQPLLKLPVREMQEFTLTSFGEKASSDLLIITYGRIGGECESACQILENEGAAVQLLRLIKIHPVPSDALKQMLLAQKILFVEEGIQTGGIGEQTLSLLNSHNGTADFRILAIDNQFVPQNTIRGALTALGMDDNAIASQVRKMLCHTNDTCPAERE